YMDDRNADSSAADALIVLGRPQDVLDRFPRQRLRCARALRHLGREDEVLADYADEPMSCIEVLFFSGRSRDIALRFPGYASSMEMAAHIEQGHPERSLAFFPTLPMALMAVGRSEEVVRANRSADLTARALILLDRADEIQGAEATTVHTLMALGKSDEAFARHGGDFRYGMWPRHLLGLEAFIAGRIEEAFARFEVPAVWELHQHQFHLAHYLIVPFLRELGGDAGALDRRCAWLLKNRRWAYDQKPWYNASSLAGTIDEMAYLAQPHAITAPADLLLCQGIRCERSGDRSAAVESYRSFVEMPRYRRGAWYDPVSERFAVWRAEVLAHH
ncbi:MAG: hypothetical protein H0W83_15695, partial [Planctomycetes bacterium]|nr:hypothetical protein [Planctomycetota bacterium]